MKNKKGIYESIRKPIAPPTRSFKNNREELKIIELEKEIEEAMDYCYCDESSQQIYNGECLDCGKEVKE